ncbi:hypothetical protein [Nocardia brasiliensis]|uniref:hypothetical protein n=1 Tax=Nocardia brasiliensis TaxID=37326 RepID=UPI003D922990
MSGLVQRPTPDGDDDGSTRRRKRRLWQRSGGRNGGPHDGREPGRHRDSRTTFVAGALAAAAGRMLADGVQHLARMVWDQLAD